MIIKMKNVSIFSLFLCLLSTPFLNTQSVGTNTIPDNSGALNVVSISKGILIRRMYSGPRTGINSPDIALLVLDTDTETFWYHQSTGWIEIAGGAFTDNNGTIRKTGNHATDDFVFGSEKLPPGTNTIDTT
jgi:hypothetical protein